MGHALDTYTFYADKPKTFFCDPIEFLSSVFFADPWSLSVGGIFANPWEFISWGFFADPWEFISWGDLCGSMGVYQLLFFADPWGSINLGDLCWYFAEFVRIIEFLQVCGFDANPRARGPEIPACRLDCHVLIGLSRSLSVVWPFGNFLKSFGFIVFNAL